MVSGVVGASLLYNPQTMADTLLTPPPTPLALPPSLLVLHRHPFKFLKFTAAPQPRQDTSILRDVLETV